MRPVQKASSPVLVTSFNVDPFHHTVMQLLQLVQKKYYADWYQVYDKC